VATLKFGMGVVGIVRSPGNTISYNVQKYEVRTISKVVTFQK